ncbi:Troponin C, isoform 2 [Eumeta japonica]|uniref:Troponin C, isoform 2 n=1 Tax=Eumeta variegata TaxID=151549 RepID=A0A4C1STP0_EUMVA|nr:Troponin C, isoform 2 [Eumeta japonica]
MRPNFKHQNSTRLPKKGLMGSNETSQEKYVKIARRRGLWFLPMLLRKRNGRFIITPNLTGDTISFKLRCAINTGKMTVEAPNSRTGKLNFDSFVRVATHFLDEDDEALQKELKEAFRLYDKEGNGYIPTSSLREILAALDDQLTPDQLNEMIAEIDTDDSGTVDFDGPTTYKDRKVLEKRPPTGLRIYGPASEKRSVHGGLLASRGRWSPQLTNGQELLRLTGLDHMRYTQAQRVSTATIDCCYRRYQLTNNMVRDQRLNLRHRELLSLKLITPLDDDNQNKITVDETMKVLKLMKGRKSAGYDRVSSEMLRGSGRTHREGARSDNSKSFSFKGRLAAAAPGRPPLALHGGLMASNRFRVTFNFLRNSFNVQFGKSGGCSVVKKTSSIVSEPEGFEFDPSHRRIDALGVNEDRGSSRGGAQTALGPPALTLTGSGNFFELHFHKSGGGSTNPPLLLTYSSDFGAGRLDPCELSTVVPYTNARPSYMVGGVGMEAGVASALIYLADAPKATCARAPGLQKKHALRYTRAHAPTNYSVHAPTPTTARARIGAGAAFTRNA